jgi:hypothetical protein
MIVLASPAGADPGVQTYTVDGRDVFRVAGRGVQSTISYVGNERLSIQRSAGSTAFATTVTYQRNDGTGPAHASASFSATMLPSGELRDEVDGDPEYLTILNQPFSVELDAATMHDLHGLRSAVPFDFPSPMTGAVLHGTLRRLPDGALHGVRVLGVAFSAQGPLNGALPNHPDILLGGTISMVGTAYYAYADALLLSLDATLAIDGKVADNGAGDAVTIVYRRRIQSSPAP